MAEPPAPVAVAAGTYDIRRLKIGRCGGLREMALRAPDFCPVILLFVQVTGKTIPHRHKKAGTNHFAPATQY